MGRPQVRLQTESKTDRRFTTIRVTRNDRVSYHKVYLYTKDEEVAPEWWRKNPDKHHEVLAEQWGMSPEEWLDHGASVEKLLDCLPHFETEKRNKGASARHRRTCAGTPKPSVFRDRSAPTA
ncbi:MAG: hypothetical protein KAV82_01835 [Phycisphaerae bacterium]|nr:hypothetical protein [Phycisphaerae bacterium]